MDTLKKLVNHFYSTGCTDESLLCEIYKIAYQQRDDERFAIALLALDPLTHIVSTHAFCQPDNFLESRIALVHRMDLDRHIVQNFVNRLYIITLAYSVADVTIRDCTV